jgi:DNA-binding CsgD family transcriptional regulator
MPARERSLHDRTLNTIAAFYEAALDESLWPDALRKLTRLTGSQASSFWVLDGAEESLDPAFTVINFDPRAVAEYVNGMARLDPTVRHLLAHPHHAIVHDGMIGDGADEQTRIYQDWHERNVETRFRLVGQAVLGPTLQAGIALHRIKKAGRYEARDLERFGVLHEHMKRALAIGARIGSLAGLQQLTAESLDRSNAAIILLDRSRRVVFLNNAAETLRSCGDGVQLLPDGIRLARPADSERLDALISEALAAVRTQRLAHGAVMPAARPSGRRPYGIHVMPLHPRSTALTLFRPAVCVLISDPDRRCGPTVQQLQNLFQLTLAEARLATCLGAGESLRRAAGQLDITYGTARSRLTQLFEKTHTRSQSELVRLLVTIL